jgi:hypothetical protein
MADNQEIAVKISADVKALLQGLKDAQEHTETAAAGMKGDLGSLIESFEKFGMASLAIGAVGLAFEGLKESFSFVKDAIDETNEMARSFKDLSYQTGINFDELNKLSAAQQLTGGTVQELEGWMKGATRSIKANSDFLIENGVAANKAALMAMPLTDYLQTVMEKAEAIENPMERGVFLQMALGRSGQEAAPQIREMLEQLKNAPEILERYGRSLDQNSVQQMERAEHAAGKVSIAMEGLKQTLADTFGDNLIAARERWTEFLSDWANGVHMIFGDGVNVAAQKQIDALKAQIDKARADIVARGAIPVGGDSGKTKPAGKHIKTPEDIAAEKKAAEDRIAIAKMAQDEIIRSAEMSVQEQIKDDKELVASGQMSYADMVSDVKMAYKQQLDTAIAAMEKERNLLAGKPVEQAAILNKEKELQQKYYADLNDLDRQSAENARKEKEKAHREEEKALRQQMELAKLAAKDELNLQKTILEEKDRALDQDLAYGRINEAQWVAMKKAGITQELRAQLDALDAEQKAAKDDLVAWTKIQNQKNALTRQAHLDMEKIEADALEKSRARWSSFFSSMTGGFDSAIQGLVKGTMTWGNAFKTVTDQALSGLISFFVQWGIEEATRWATSLALNKTGNVDEAQGAAALYAVNAMASAAEIPMIGWAMAPGVGEAAYAEGLAMAGLASAEGGWDRVPQDTLAMIHKNEMVLPADLAGNIRAMASGGDHESERRNVSITIQAMDGQDVHRVLTKHQDSLFRIFREGGRNGRL